MPGAGAETGEAARGPTPGRAAQSQRLRQALQELPPHYRAVIELRHYQDLSYEEMAQALRVSLSDVKSHLFRARRLLARRLGSK